MAPDSNRKYGHVAITVDDLIAEGQSWKVRAPRFIITSALAVVDAFVRSENPVGRAYARLQDDVVSPRTISVDALRAASTREDSTHTLLFSVYCPETDQDGPRRCDTGEDISHMKFLIR
jgi:hypothetical protein